MDLPPGAGKDWAGPRIRMQLPSFSGAIAECPQLLQYACQLCTNVRPVPAAHVMVQRRFLMCSHVLPPVDPAALPSGQQLTCLTPCLPVQDSCGIDVHPGRGISTCNGMPRLRLLPLGCFRQITHRPKKL